MKMVHALALLLAVPALGSVEDLMQAALKGDAQARVQAILKLGDRWDEEVSRQFQGLLKSAEDGGVLVAIVEAAGRHGDAGATAVLKKALSLKSGGESQAWRAKAAAAKALLARQGPGDLELAMEVMKDKDDRVLQALCESLAELAGDPARDALQACLVHDDWRVRSAAIQALGRRQSDPKSAALLLDRLRKEQGRLLDDVRRALTALVGKDLGLDPSAWHAEIRRERESGASSAGPGVEEAVTHAGSVTYHDVTTHSKRMIFVMDCSASMKRNDRIGKEKAKMIEALQGIDKHVWFNILTFAEDVGCWKESLVQATEENRKEACAFVGKLQLGQSTNTWAAMKTALDMARGATIPSRKVSKEQVASASEDNDGVAGYGKAGADTIFLMSDGAPALDGKALDWRLIADQVREYNRTKRVVIHTIGIGEAQPAFMKRLAEESGGTYVGIP